MLHFTYKGLPGQLGTKHVVDLFPGLSVSYTASHETNIQKVCLIERNGVSLESVLCGNIMEMLKKLKVEFDKHELGALEKNC